MNKENRSEQWLKRHFTQIRKDNGNLEIVFVIYLELNEESQQ